MNKKIKLLLAVLVIVVLVWIINSTFSKYANNAQATITKRIGQWVIKVNNVDITEIYREANDDSTIDVSDPVDFEIPINEMVWYENSTKAVLANKLQPGGVGYFTIVIDPEGTETSLRYTITIDQTSLLDKNAGLHISNVKLNGSDLTIADLTADEIVTSEIITLADIKDGRVDELQVEVEWTNDNDRDDSELAGERIALPVSVNVIQYTGT
ncbi:MAG: hypothetical protein K6D97_03040 [Clostridia bacterium]|nr:hypothetical protein [Clostridia bacterium]